MGLHFIAHWVELVVARLQVTINDLTVNVYSHHGPSHPFGVLSMFGLTFHNSDLATRPVDGAGDLFDSIRATAQSPHLSSKILEEISAKKVPTSHFIASQLFASFV